MPGPDPRHALLRRQWAEERSLLEHRRRHLQAAAAAAARALRERWPQLEAVWLFGSAAAPDTFRRHSDLDLAVGGLPPEAQITALGVVEREVDAALAAAGEAGTAIDLVRIEDLDPHWQGRLRERALPLP